MNRTYFSLEKQIQELETEPVESRKNFISINKQLGLLNEELENHFFEAYGGTEQWIYRNQDASHTSLGVFSQNWNESDQPVQHDAGTYNRAGYCRTEFYSQNLSS